MTEEEFVLWCDEDVKAEFNDGRVIAMSPVSVIHSEVFGRVYTLLRLFVGNRRLGQVLGSELQARLRVGLRRVPDIFFVAKEHLNRLRENHLEGAPDLVVEIVSPESSERDWREKYLEYAAAGVREYWAIYPLGQQVRQYRLSKGRKYATIPSEEGVHRSEVVPGFLLREEWLWGEPLPTEIELLKELGVL